MKKEEIISMHHDVTFLLNLIPKQWYEVPEELAPQFYISGTEKGDKLIAKRLKQIRQKYSAN